MSCIDPLNRTGGARKPNFDFTYLSQRPSFDHDYDHVDDDFVDDNDNADQNLPPAGEGGDVEGHVGEDEEGL